MLVGNTTNSSPLSAAQLNTIYSCPDAGGTAPTWHEIDPSNPSTDHIVPIIPQVGSGTRSTFLADISNPTLGPCVVTAEENDPTAIAAQCANAPDAIEPMSGGRLNLFLGDLSTGASNGVGGYFKDPSCPLQHHYRELRCECEHNLPGSAPGHYRDPGQRRRAL